MNKSGELQQPSGQFANRAFKGGQEGAAPTGLFANQSDVVAEGGSGRFHTGGAWAQVEKEDVPATRNNAIELYRQRKINESQVCAVLGITPQELERGIKAGYY